MNKENWLSKQVDQRYKTTCTSILSSHSLQLLLVQCVLWCAVKALIF